MAAPRILLVEDDERLAELTAEYLSKNDFEVAIEPRGDTACTRIPADNPDVVVLDVMLPGKDGFEVCRTVRPHYQGVILMLTARDEDMDQILGLELGADDFISKPVQPRVLLARVRALLRRAGPSEGSEGGGAGDELVFGRFRINQATRSAELGDAAIELTSAEFDLLWLLIRSRNRVVTRDAILARLWDYDADVETRTVDVHIRALRRKLGDQRIETVVGLGYRYREGATA